jgi:hypothetical protein
VATASIARSAAAQPVHHAGHQRPIRRADRIPRVEFLQTTLPGHQPIVDGQTSWPRRMRDRAGEMGIGPGDLYLSQRPASPRSVRVGKDPDQDTCRAVTGTNARMPKPADSMNHSPVVGSQLVAGLRTACRTARALPNRIRPASPGDEDQESKQNALHQWLRDGSAGSSIQRSSASAPNTLKAATDCLLLTSILPCLAHLSAGGVGQNMGWQRKLPVTLCCHIRNGAVIRPPQSENRIS